MKKSSHRNCDAANVNVDDVAAARRNFLKFLAASPYVASIGGVAAFMAQSGIDAQEITYPQPWEFASPTGNYSNLITNPSQALDVFDFEEVAHTKVMQGHWAYMVSGVDSDATLHANREGFNHVQLRPRRLRDMTKVDMSVNLFGTVYNSPIFTCPTAGQKNMHPDGELGVARAAKAHGTLQYLSTDSATPVEDVNQAHGTPVWYQVYAPNIWDACSKLLHRVEAAGCTVIALTVDNVTGRNSETELRTRPKDLTQCKACHQGPAGPARSELPMLANLQDIKGTPQPLDWKYADMIRKAWKGKFVMKGILTPEDARMAIEHGIDAIHVSNHGGRDSESLESTIQALPAVVAEVKGRVPVFVDSGFRRGTDVFKALALGAKAVGIGRPVLWGLGAFGQAGVDKVIDIMQRELKLAMGNCGTLTVADITRDYVILPSNWKA